MIYVFWHMFCFCFNDFVKNLTGFARTFNCLCKNEKERLCRRYMWNFKEEHSFNHLKMRFNTAKSEANQAFKNYELYFPYLSDRAKRNE